MPTFDHERLTRNFFRRVNSPALFQRFFDDFGVWEDMAATIESKNDEIYATWEDLECEGRDEIQEALCRINDIGREKGRFTLLERAKDCDVEDYEDLTLQKLAMILYLDHRDAFDEAYDFFVLEKTENLHTPLGDRPVRCKPPNIRIGQFKEELQKALRRETEGPQLRVEVVDHHPDKWMATIPHQHYVRPDHEFDDHGEIVTRDRRPVYEMVLIYYPDTGVLKLKAGRGRKKVQRVAAVFAEYVLQQDPAFFSPCDLINFEPLQDDGLKLAPEPGDYFEWAKAVQVRYSKCAEPGTEYHVHLRDVRPGHAGVLDTLEKDGVDPASVDIKSLSLCFKFPNKKRDTRTVELTRPNRVSLDETERDRHIEEVLVRWGLLDHEAKVKLARAGQSRRAV